MTKQTKVVRTKQDVEEWHGKLKGAIAKHKVRKELTGGLLGLLGLAPDNMPKVKGRLKKPLKVAPQKAS